MPNTQTPPILSLVHETSERQVYESVMEDCLAYIASGNEPARERFLAAEARLAASADLAIINECIENSDSTNR